MNLVIGQTRHDVSSMDNRSLGGTIELELLEVEYAKQRRSRQAVLPFTCSRFVAALDSLN